MQQKIVFRETLKLTSLLLSHHFNFFDLQYNFLPQILPLCCTTKFSLTDMNRRIRIQVLKKRIKESNINLIKMSQFYIISKISRNVIYISISQYFYFNLLYKFQLCLTLQKYFSDISWITMKRVIKLRVESVTYFKKVFQ